VLEAVSQLIGRDDPLHNQELAYRLHRIDGSKNGVIGIVPHRGLCDVMLMQLGPCIQYTGWEKPPVPARPSFRPVTLALTLQ
jgi:hypothetical protein